MAAGIVLLGVPGTAQAAQRYQTRTTGLCGQAPARGAVGEAWLPVPSRQCRGTAALLRLPRQGLGAALAQLPADTPQLRGEPLAAAAAEGAVLVVREAVVVALLAGLHTSR